MRTVSVGVQRLECSGSQDLCLLFGVGQLMNHLLERTQADAIFDDLVHSRRKDRRSLLHSHGDEMNGQVPVEDPETFTVTLLDKSQLAS